MTEKLHRVNWRMLEMTPFREDLYSNHQLDIAISEECGSSDRTLRDIKKQMKKLGLIESAGLGLWKIRPVNRTDYGYGVEEKQSILLGTSDR